MEIRFRTKHLEKLANDPKYCQVKLGAKGAKEFLKRINALYDADTLEDVRNLPGRFHELKVNRKGQWACNLEHPYRLIFVPTAYPIPSDDDGKYIWLDIIEVEIINMEDYH